MQHTAFLEKQERVFQRKQEEVAEDSGGREDLQPGELRQELPGLGGVRTTSGGTQG